MLKNIKGTYDILPSEVAYWQKMEQVFRSTPQQFGYQEIRTPIIESTDLFVRGVGEGTDVVGKEMYTFNDKGSDSITLRPELTAPVARAILQYNMLRSYPTCRLWYYGSCFRYEQPQLGRQRQFHQIGAECLGSQFAESDAEIIILANTILRNCDIPSFSLNINSIGTIEERQVYRKVLTDYLNDNSEKLSDESRKRISLNPLRTLDSKDSQDKLVVESAPNILDYLGNESTDRFLLIQDLLIASGIGFTVNPRLVRGLDYYSHTVFEFRTELLGSQDALGGGGRYDDLFASLGSSNPTPGVGFGLGVERLILLAKKLSDAEQADPNTPYYSPVDIVIVSSPEYVANVYRIATKLRSDGFSVLTDIQQRGFKAQFRDAEKVHAKVAIIIGESEVERDVLTVKNLILREQIEVSSDGESLLQTMQSIING
jgi:histidyl-tRNA synthetase